ncbi:MAG: hypothetical protein B5M56_08685 [Desulfococcus sp. 4484_241]|nr:MAG: hypothetical protein B5M56_08685 [Desulfococcus sp. 4484_241]RLC32581.1 MAG: hypothetical protein DRH32_02680 [Deltaproteobacteria bacterium]
MDLEYITCNLCGADDSRTLYTIQGMEIQRCRCCGLVYVNPKPFKVNTETIYNTEYFNHHVLNAAVNRHTYAKRLGFIEKFLPGKGRLLDVGCGSGEFLEIAKSRGWETTGIDISPVHRDKFRTHLGIPLVVGDFNDVDFPAESFDAVTLGDSIEHMHNPRDAVKKIFSILRPGGIGYIRTPDISHIIPRLAGKRWIQLKPLEHLYYFSRSTMRLLLENEGFNVITIRSSGIYCTLDVLHNRLQYYYNPRLMLKLLGFLSDTLRLGRIRFYFDPLEEMQVVFRKPLC